MHYLTRHLEALRDIPHGRHYLIHGQQFHASEIDADYYLSRGMAKGVSPAADTPAPAVEPSAQARRRTRTAVATMPTEPQTPAAPDALFPAADVEA